MECCEALDTGMKEERDSTQFLTCQNGRMLLAHKKMNATYVKTVKVKITEHLDFLRKMISTIS